MCIRFEKVDGIVRVDDETRCLALLDPEKYDAVCNGIRWIMIQKVVLYMLFLIIMPYDSNGSLPLGKTLNLHNVIILIKSVFDKDENNYYYDIFLEKNVHINNVDMLFCDRIDVSHQIDVNKKSRSKESNIFHYWYYLDK